MIYRNNSGSALVDYIVPTAVVGLVVGMSLYALVSEDKILNFSAASARMDIKKGEQMAIVGRKESTNSMWDKITAGSFGGTEDTPVSNCQSGSCIIDYGNFILNGIPENLEEFVEVNGTSAGTDSIASAMEEIADQLVKDGESQAAQQVKDLSKMFKIMALLEKEEEKAASTAKTPTEYEALIKTKDSFKIPSELKEAIPTFIEDNKSVYDELYWKIGEEKQSLLKYTDETIREKRKQNNFTDNIVLKFDEVMESSNISSTMK
ncbi:MAG: hypothetical protein AB7V50_10985, partial [Vampirovibrionia bacterium]